MQQDQAGVSGVPAVAAAAAGGLRAGVRAVQDARFRGAAVRPGSEGAAAERRVPQRGAGDGVGEGGHAVRPDRGLVHVPGQGADPDGAA